MTEPCLEKYMRPYWGIVIGIYEEIKGVEMPLSKIAYTEMGIDGGASGCTSGYYDHVGYSYLLNKRNGLVSEENKPTELKGFIKYNGNLYDVIPSLDLEKSLGNINDDIIYHSELGGLINNYTINTNVGVPIYSTLTLITKLPGGEVDTGNWKWDTGETEQNLTIEVIKSYAYRVTYTNVNGIESKLLFTIAVQGDCEETKASQYIYLNDNQIGNDKVEVVENSTLKLELNVIDEYGTILWSTGETDYTINIPYLSNSRNITAIFTNICGRQFVYIYQLNVIDSTNNNNEDNSLISFESTNFTIQRKTSGNTWEEDNYYFINNNEILSIDTKNERQKYFYIGVNCDYSPPETYIDYIKLVPSNSDYFQECEITINLIKNKIKFNLNLSTNLISTNSYGIFSLSDIIYNVDKINMNFQSFDENENKVNYINIENLEINKFTKEEEFEIIEKRITTNYLYNKSIIIKISSDNECFEPEINQYQINIINSMENENEFDEKMIEQIIINKTNELKINIRENFENNIQYEENYFNIYFYNTSESSQNNAIIKESLSNVNLMNCEKILKAKYNIPENEVLNIMKIDIKRKETNSLQVEYEIYSEDFQLLNLNDCFNETVRITIPYSLKNIKMNKYRKLSEEIDLEKKYKLGLKFGYDILDPNSPFYNDICTEFDSEYSTDLIIEDRKKYYYLPQMFCEDTCNYVSYNINTYKVNCDCKIKIEPKYNYLFRNFSDNKINSDFNKKISHMNFQVLKCINEGSKNFTENIGVWLILIIFLFFCILSVFAILFDINLNKLNIEGEPSENENLNYSEIKLSVMPYELSLLNDKRNFIQMYLGILKYNNIISFTFISKSIKNKYLKMMILLFFIVLLFLFNLFLFLDKDFTNIYLNEDKYDFGQEYPMALSVTFICLLINMVIRMLLKEKNKNLKMFKVITDNRTSNNDNQPDENVVLNISEKKFNFRIIIFIIVFIFVTIYVFLHLISFGGIFVNNQKYLIIRVVLSLLTSFIIPFFLCLIYALLRYIGIKKEKRILYNISSIIQNY